MLVRAVFDARSYEQAEVAQVRLKAHASGKKLPKTIHTNLGADLMHLHIYNRGLFRVAPDWLWSDLCLRVSWGRNHGSDQRLQRTMLLWATYRICARAMQVRTPASLPSARTGPAGDGQSPARTA